MLPDLPCAQSHKQVYCNLLCIAAVMQHSEFMDTSAMYAIIFQGTVRLMMFAASDVA